MGERMLLCEGSDDKEFYEALCREAGLKDIEVKPPARPVKSKTHAIQYLEVLLRQMNDGSLKRLGLVVDADYAATHGLGCAGTLDKIREKLDPAGFDRPQRLSTGGLVFEHNHKKLAPVGVWIMPDNHSEGMLEDFIKTALRSGDALHPHACGVVSALPETRFKPIHRAKAEIATFLAWQAMPGKRLVSTVGDGLLDLAAPPCSAFTGWLRAVFP